MHLGCVFTLDRKLPLGEEKPLFENKESKAKKFFLYNFKQIFWAKRPFSVECSKRVISAIGMELFPQMFNILIQGLFYLSKF